VCSRSAARIVPQPRTRHAAACDDVQLGEVLLTVLEMAVLPGLDLGGHHRPSPMSSRATTSPALPRQAWMLLIMLVQLVGVLCYVVVRGDKMK
jgi:hypothetical protein